MLAEITKLRENRFDGDVGFRICVGDMMLV